MLTRLQAKSSMTDNSQTVLSLIEALKDPSVVDRLKKSIGMDTDTIADRVLERIDERLKRMEVSITAKDKKIEALEAKVEELEKKMDDAEQYSRRTSVRIAGIPEGNTETNDEVRAKTNALFESIGVSPTISRLHRVGPKKKVTSASSSAAPAEPPKPRPILVQFTSYQDKSDIMKASKELPNINKDVYINEDLTRIRSKILYEARQLKKKKKIHKAWSFDGRIAVEDNNKKVHPIINLCDLFAFR